MVRDLAESSYYVAGHVTHLHPLVEFLHHLLSRRYLRGVRRYRDIDLAGKSLENALFVMDFEVVDEGVFPWVVVEVCIAGCRA